MGSRFEPGDSLDFFPTPPWATRALMEHAFPALRIDPQEFGFVSEPACGEGHMAEVLREYCSTVLASDVFGYGYGDVRDFLRVEAPARPDWIITNPPFGENTIRSCCGRSVSRASALPCSTDRSGQSRELSAGRRYSAIRPPTLAAFFVERVNLCKGRWEPDGDTATAYCWLVWLHGVAPRAPMWIPPGCRKALNRPGDVARFTAHPVQRRAGDKRVVDSAHAIAARDGASRSHDNRSATPQ